MTPGGYVGMAAALADGADTLDVLELATELAARETALAGGAGPRRPLTAGEVRSRADFAAHDRGVAAIAAQTFDRLAVDRLRLLELVRAYARSVEKVYPTVTAEQARTVLLELGAGAILQMPGVPALRTDARLFHETALQDAAALGAHTARLEAGAQGLTLPAPPAALANLDDHPGEAGPYRPQAPAGATPPPETAAEIAARASYAATGPVIDAAVLLRDITFRMPVTGWRWGTFIDHVLNAAGQTSTAGLATDVARAPAQQAWGIGRLAEAAGIARATGEPAEVYASELNDRTTCRACDSIDGTLYPTLEAGRADYPAGTYLNCEGGPRCRGTLVIVWRDESPAAVP